MTSVCNVKIRVIGNCSATDFSFFSADAVLGVITYIIAIIMSVFFALFYFLLRETIPYLLSLGYILTRVCYSDFGNLCIKKQISNRN